MENRNDRKALDDLWHQRLNAAKTRLDLARHRTNEIDRQLKAGLIPSPDGSFSYRKALREENLAMEEYYEAVRIFSELVLHGTIPDEAKWKKSPTPKPPE